MQGVFHKGLVHGAKAWRSTRMRVPVSNVSNGTIGALPKIFERLVMELPVCNKARPHVNGTGARAHDIGYDDIVGVVCVITGKTSAGLQWLLFRGQIPEIS